MIILVMLWKQILLQWVWVNVKMVNVSSHSRTIKGKRVKVSKYNRQQRKESKKRIVNKKVYLKSKGKTMYRVQNGNGEYIGWKLKWDGIC